jgi:hypothetical protein
MLMKDLKLFFSLLGSFGMLKEFLLVSLKKCIVYPNLHHSLVNLGRLFSVKMGCAEN